MRSSRERNPPVLLNFGTACGCALIAPFALICIGAVWLTPTWPPRSLEVRVDPQLDAEEAWRRGKTELSSGPASRMEVWPWRIAKDRIGITVRHCNPPYHEDIVFWISTRNDSTPSVEIGSAAYREGTIVLSSAALDEEVVAQYELTFDDSGDAVTRRGKVLVTPADFD